MSSEGPGPAVSSRLGYLLKHVGLRMMQLNEKALTPFGIEGRELPVLAMLDDHEPSSQQQLAQRLGVDRTSMVALLDGLERKGLVARRPQAGDRRRNVVGLTETGQDVLDKATEAATLAERELLAPLTGDDGERLRELLKAVLRLETQPEEL